MEFNLVPYQSKVITKAVIRLYYIAGSGTQDARLNQQTVAQIDEDTLTWNNMPAMGSLITNIPDGVGWHEMDVTTYVQGRLSSGWAGFACDIAAGVADTYSYRWHSKAS